MMKGFSLVQLHVKQFSTFQLSGISSSELKRQVCSGVGWFGPTNESGHPQLQWCSKAFRFSIWISGNNGWTRNTSHIFSCHLPLACWALKLGSSTRSARSATCPRNVKKKTPSWVHHWWFTGGSSWIIPYKTIFWGRNIQLYRRSERLGIRVPLSTLKKRCFVWFWLIAT